MLKDIFRPIVRRLRALVKPPLHRPDIRGDYTVIGTDYGGWPALSGSLDQHSVVYSFGVGEDVSFDLGVIEAFGCTVHAFDPTPRCITWIDNQDLPERFCFYPLGLVAAFGRDAPGGLPRLLDWDVVMLKEFPTLATDSAGLIGYDVSRHVEPAYGTDGIRRSVGMVCGRPDKDLNRWWGVEMLIESCSSSSLLTEVKGAIYTRYRAVASELSALSNAPLLIPQLGWKGAACVTRF